MKLAERFEHFTITELQRAIDTRQHIVVKTKSEIRALEKLKLAKANAAEADYAAKNAKAS